MQSCFTLFTKRWSVHLMQLCQILTDLNNFCTAKAGNKFYKLDMHLLTYYINNILLIITAICRCLLITFAANHTADERRRSLLCRHWMRRHFERCLWLLFSNWQCYDDSTVNFVITVDCLFYLVLNANVKQMIAFWTSKTLLFHLMK